MNQTGEQFESPNGDGRSVATQQRILRMSVERKTERSIESVLHERIEALAQAIRDKDVDRVMSFYAKDVVVFDVRPPLDVRGADGYRKNFERWFASIEGPMGFDFLDLSISAGEGASFCHYLAHITGTRPGDRTVDYWVRGTSCFERWNGHWLITHEHISMPAHM
jgi:ketosteroid isomerase-like protein